VPRKYQARARLIPNSQREHASQPAKQRLAPFLVPVGQDLAVRHRSEPVAACDKLRPQLAPIVDLAVQQRLNRTVLVRHRAVAVLAQVEDAQATMNETGARSDEHTFSIRA